MADKAEAKEAKEVEAKCGHCGSTDVYGISRVVGYYSRINNWNKSKQAEFVDRQKGEYKLFEKKACTCD